MIALCGLLLATTLLSTPAARAGSWTYVVTGDDTGSSFTDNGQTGTVPAYSPASSGSGSSAGCPSLTVTRPNNGNSGTGCSINLVVHVQVVFTWHPSTGQTMITDPPPPNVLVLESSNSFWSASSGDAQHPGTASGSAANGLGDKEYDPPAFQSAYSNLGYSGPPPNQSYPSPVPALVPHFKKYPAASGTVTVDSHTLTATATANATNWYYGAQAIVGSYTASIHAQPYNFQQYGAGIDNGDGTLSWNYIWNSTTGSLPDIGTGCTIYEYVSYADNTIGTHIPGSPGGYIPPAPPIAISKDGKIHGYVDPTIAPSPAVPGGWAGAGVMNDIQDKPLTFAPSSSLVGASWKATQTYKFDDTATGEKGTVVPGPGAGPMTITRTVYPVGTPPYIPTWYYTVNKSGSTSIPLQLP